LSAPDRARSRRSRARQLPGPVGLRAARGPSQGWCRTRRTTRGHWRYSFRRRCPETGSSPPAARRRWAQKGDDGRWSTRYKGRAAAPGVVVAPDNLKFQVFALRKALGEDRELVLTEHGRGYRFTAAVNRLGSDRNERRRWPHYHARHSGHRARRRRPIRSISPRPSFSETLLDPAS